jgi:hypothetical protein
MARRKLDRKSDHRRAGPTHARAGRRSSDEIILPLAVEVGRIGIFETDFSRKRTRFSPELCGLLGLPVGTIMSYAESSRIIHEDDRTRVQALLDEIALQQSGATDGTGVRAGKIIGAGRMVGGDLTLQGNQLRARADVIDVATTTNVGNSATDAQALEQLFTLEKNIVLSLFTNFGITLTTADRNAIEQRPTRSLAAFLSYSRGLALEDQGRYDDASRMYQDAVRIDPSFGQARQKGQETQNISRGNQVTAATVENGLRGTAEGAAVASATRDVSTTSVGGVAASTAQDLNPSVAGAATSGAGVTGSNPARDPSSGTGGDNPTTKTAKVTITITQPRP